jgi:hypothetical protein
MLHTGDVERPFTKSIAHSLPGDERVRGVVTALRYTLGDSTFTASACCLLATTFKRHLGCTGRR